MALSDAYRFQVREMVVRLHGVVCPVEGQHSPNCDAIKDLFAEAAAISIDEGMRIGMHSREIITDTVAALLKEKGED